MLNFLVTTNNEKGIYIALAMVTFLFVTVTLAILIYLLLFRKREFKERYLNKKALIIIFSVLAINIPIIIMIYLIVFVMAVPQAVLIVMLVIGFLITLGVGLYIFIFLNTLAIGIDEREIAFLGERILIRKINRVERNDKTNQLIIHFTEGTRSKKKSRFSLASQAGQFILNNVDLLNQEIMMYVGEDQASNKKK